MRTAKFGANCDILTLQNPYKLRPQRSEPFGAFFVLGLQTRLTISKDATDRPPSTAALRARFLESDQLRTLDIPNDERLQAPAKSIASAMQGGTASSVRQACARFLSVASGF